MKPSQSTKPNSSPAIGFGSPPVIAPTTSVSTSAITISAMKLTTNGTAERFMVVGSSLAAFSHGLLKPMYQTAPNNQATTAETITASQFTTEKSMLYPLQT